jgi:predicted RNase H-like HicB family nuclease
VGSQNRYELIIYSSAEDDVFVADVPELPGCSAHGATQELALANAQEAIGLWIETAREFGDPVPEPKGRRLIFA